MAVEIVVYIVRLRLLGEKDPSSAAEYLYILRVCDGKAGQDMFNRQLFAPFP